MNKTQEIYEKLDGAYNTESIADHIRGEIEQAFIESVVGLDPDGYDLLPEELQHDLFQKFIDRIMVYI